VGGDANSTLNTSSSAAATTNTYAAYSASNANAGAGGYGTGVATGADGGDATNSNTVSSTNAANTGYSYADTNTYGGAGGYINSGSAATAGQGGDATSSTTATSVGNNYTYSNDYAVGGSGGVIASGTGDGGDGGNASSSASSAQSGATSQTAYTTARADGGSGGYGRGTGQTGGDGGIGSASATVVGTGTGTANASATVYGGHGGHGYDGADGGAGAAASLADAVTGSNDGNLTLTQNAYAGNGGDSDGGIAGSGGLATSTLTGANAAGGNVTVNVTGEGGAGGAGTLNTDGANGAGAVVSGTGTSTGGGVVTVNVTGTGGAGGRAVDGNAGEGASIALTDVTSGSTTGRLNLTQTANGGAGGAITSGGTGASGNGGTAFSEITRAEIVSDFVDVDVNAHGGVGGNNVSGTAGTGGSATANNTVSSSSGTVYGYADSDGGAGGSGNGTGASGGVGGDANSTLNTSSSAAAATNSYAAYSVSTANAGAGGYGTGVATGADGGDATNTNTVSSTNTANTGYSSADTNTYGGAGGYINSGSAATAGQGGDATSTTTATSVGNNYTYSNDYAAGGAGGFINSGTGDGGDGGDATSSATSSKNGSGSNSSSAVARANGGDGRYGRGPGFASGNGGDATATASAFNLDAMATANASAYAGQSNTSNTGSIQGTSGVALATATAQGTSGSAISTAQTDAQSGLVTQANATSNAQVGSTSIAQSHAAYGSTLINVSGVVGQQASTFITAAPDGSVLIPEMRDSAVLANFDISNGSTVFDSGQLNSDIIGYGVLNGAYSADGTGAARTYTSTANFDVDTSNYVDGNQQLLLGFMSPDSLGDGFTDADNTSVAFEVRVEGNVLINQTFTNSADAIAYFADQTKVIDLSGVTQSGVLDVQVKMTVDSDTVGDGFATDFVLGNSTITPRAVPYIADTTVNVGEMHTGATVLGGVNIQNVANAGSDGADASFIATTGNAITNGGTLSSLAAGSSNNTSLQLGIDSASAGNKSGTATVLLRTDGVVTGTAEDFGQEVVTVTGSVFDYAAPGTLTPVDLGEVHVGDSAVANISIANTALNNGFSESLDASFTGVTSGATSSAVGAIDNLGPQSSDNTSMSITLDTNTAGVRNGTAEINFISDPNGINSLGSTDLGNVDAQASVTAFRLAEADLSQSGQSHVRLNDAANTTLTINNTAIADAFSEGLDASFSANAGNAIGSGVIDNLAAGSASTSMTIALDTSTLGVSSGTSTISFVSDGDGINSLGQTALGTQDVNVSTIVTQLAAGSVQDTVNFGNVHVGDSVAGQTVTVTNTRNGADADYTDYLMASWDAGAAVTQVTLGGSVSGLAAGGSSNGLTVGLDTATAGNINGLAAVNLTSDGTRFGLGTTDLGSEDVNILANIEVNGSVYRLANPEINNDPYDLGNVRQGSAAPTALVSITNNAPNDGFTEALDASVAGVSGSASGAGSFNDLGAMSTDASSISVGLASTATAGAQSGTVTIDFVSDGDAIGNGLGQTALASQSVDVSANVFRLANGEVDPNPIEFVSRVGDTVSQNLTISNTAAADGYSEFLDASGSASGNAAISGSVLALVAGASDASSMQVSADTSTSGTTSGTVAVAYESNGQSLGLGSNISIGEQIVEISTTVYDYAVSAVTDVIDFGTVRIGSVANAIANIANTGSGALVDDLSELSRTVDNSFSVDSLTGSIAAGNSTNLGVSMDTSVAGVYSGSATFDFVSSNGILQDVSIGSESIALSGTVNNLAEASFIDIFDASNDALLSNTGTDYFLDFGTISLSEIGNVYSDTIGLQNSAFGPADNLTGYFESWDNTGCVFCLTGFDSFVDLDVSDILDSLLISLDTSGLGLGLYEDSILFNGFSTLDGFSDIALSPINLRFALAVVDDVASVSEPDTLFLICFGLLGLGFVRRYSSDKRKISK
jgi:hypothetical protein